MKFIFNNRWETRTGHCYYNKNAISKFIFRTISYDTICPNLTILAVFSYTVQFRGSQDAEATLKPVELPVLLGPGN